MQLRRKIKRFAALVLAMSMALGCMPVGAWAEATTPTDLPPIIATDGEAVPEPALPSDEQEAEKTDDAPASEDSEVPDESHGDSEPAADGPASEQEESADDTLTPANKAVSENVITVYLENPILNRLIYTPVTITKTDITGAKKLPGALIEVYDADGNTIYREYTNEKGEIPNIPVVPGTYTFKETYAPSGYALNTAIKTFTVTADGKGDGRYRNPGRAEQGDAEENQAERRSAGGCGVRFV